MPWVPPLLSALGAYLLLGLAFAIPFAIRGAGALDPAAAHAPLAFRALIVPGAAALWPLLLVNWLRARRAGRP